MVEVHKESEKAGKLRKTNAALDVFQNPFDPQDPNINPRGAKLGTIASEQTVRLTGWMGPGIAQIAEPLQQGWLDARHLALVEPEQGKGPYKVEARDGLKAYWHDYTPQTYKDQQDGPKEGSEVYLTEPEDHFVKTLGGRPHTYVRIIYRDSIELDDPELDPRRREELLKDGKQGYVTQGDAPPGQNGSTLIKIR